MDNMNCIKIYAANCGYYDKGGDSVSLHDSSPTGGVGCYIGFDNKSKKTITQVTFVVVPYNASNEVVSCHKTGESEKRLICSKYIGPDVSSGEIAWIDVWYNTDIRTFVIKSAEVEFVDKTIVKLDDTMLGKTHSGSLGNSDRNMRKFTIGFVVAFIIGLIFLLVSCSSSGSSSNSYKNYDDYDRYYSNDEISDFVYNYDNKW